MPNKQELIELLEIVKEKGDLELLNEYEKYQDIVKKDDDIYIKTLIRATEPFDEESMKFVTKRDAYYLRRLITTKKISLENLKQLFEEIKKLKKNKKEALELAKDYGICKAIEDDEVDFSHLLDIINELEKTSDENLESFYDVARYIIYIIKNPEFKSSHHIDMLKKINISLSKENAISVKCIALDTDIKDRIKSGEISPDTWLGIMNYASKSENEEKYHPIRTLASDKKALCTIATYENNNEVLLNIVKYINNAKNDEKALEIVKYLQDENVQKLIRNGFEEHYIYVIIEAIANSVNQISDNIDFITDKDFINLVLSEELSKDDYSFYSRELFKVNTCRAMERREDLKVIIRKRRLENLNNVLKELKGSKEDEIPEAIQRKRI